jgi:hypothetical protein
MDRNEAWIGVADVDGIPTFAEILRADAPA